MPTSPPPRINLDNILSADRGKLIALEKKRREFARTGASNDELNKQFDGAFAAACAPSRIIAARSL